MDYGSVKKRVLWLVDDTDQSYATDAYLTECANQSYEYLQGRADLTDYSFDEQRVEIPGVNAGASDLNAYFKTGQPLEFMILPTRLEWKQAGTAATNYQDAILVETLQDLTPGQFIQYWMWEFGSLQFNPSTLALDLRVTGTFTLTPLAKDEDVIAVARNFGHVLAYCMAMHIGIQRGNAQWEKSYQDKTDESFDNWAIKMVKDGNRKVLRIGRMSRRVAQRPTIITR